MMTIDSPQETCLGIAGANHTHHDGDAIIALMRQDDCYNAKEENEKLWLLA